MLLWCRGPVPRDRGFVLQVGQSAPPQFRRRNKQQGVKAVREPGANPRVLNPRTTTRPIFALTLSVFGELSLGVDIDEIRRFLDLSSLLPPVRVGLFAPSQVARRELRIIKFGVSSFAFNQHQEIPHKHQRMAGDVHPAFTLSTISVRSPRHDFLVGQLARYTTATGVVSEIPLFEVRNKITNVENGKEESHRGAVLAGGNVTPVRHGRASGFSG